MNVLRWIQENRELLYVCFGLLLNLVGVIYHVWRSCRVGGMSQPEDWLAILEAARQFEQEAELLFEGSTAEKLQYVLSKLRAFTAERGLPFEEARLTKQIEADMTRERDQGKSERQKGE